MKQNRRRVTPRATPSRRLRRAQSRDQIKSRQRTVRAMIRESRRRGGISVSYEDLADTQRLVPHVNPKRDLKARKGSRGQRGVR